MGEAAGRAFQRMGCSGETWAVTRIKSSQETDFTETPFYPSTPCKPPSKHFTHFTPFDPYHNSVKYYVLPHCPDEGDGAQSI